MKLCGEPQGSKAARRYSAGECCGAIKQPMTGKPDEKHISTSFVERQNLTMRMSMRRFTRLTNGFLKKMENLEHAVSLHFMHYNFGRIHKRCALRQRWNQGYRITSGHSKKLLRWQTETLP